MTPLHGIDHVYLSVSELTRAEVFYDALLVQTLGCRKQGFTLADEPHLQYIGQHFSVVLRPARVQQPHQPYAPGLHHLCLRVDSADDVRAVATQLQALGLPATAAHAHPDYAPDYVATFVEDPDGIRLEVTNHRAERRARHDTWQATHPDAPASVVQRQFEAWNARDLDAWAATYAPAASQYEHPATVLATGREAIRARMIERFQDPAQHARLLRRSVMGTLVIDEEAVTRSTPEGLACRALTAIYQVSDGLIQSASFVFGDAMTMTATL
jgi:catechol 2,3-dioxygenase-like lactoylglutathione lyase family enzyme